MLRKTLYTFYVTINIRKIKTIFQKIPKKIYISQICTKYVSCEKRKGVKNLTTFITFKLHRLSARKD